MWQFTSLKHTTQPWRGPDVHFSRTGVIFPCRQASVGKQFITSRLLGECGIGAGGIACNDLIAEWAPIIRKNFQFNPQLKASRHLYSGVPIFTLGENFLWSSSMEKEPSFYTGFPRCLVWSSFQSRSPYFLCTIWNPSLTLMLVSLEKLFLWFIPELGLERKELEVQLRVQRSVGQRRKIFFGSKTLN